MSKKFTKILCGLFAVILLASCAMIGASASSAYKTYTYSIKGFSLLSPDAYTAIMTVDSDYMGLEVPIDSPSDILTDDENNVYIADSGNDRIICIDRYYKLKFIIKEFVNDQGVSDKLTKPEGLFVTDDRIWVCDTGANRIVVFDRKGNFKGIIPEPQSTLFDDNAVYRPVAMAVDQYDRIYVVSSTTYQGIIVMNENGVFTGFVGAQAVSVSAWDIFWRRFKTDAQKEMSVENVSTEYNNINIDKDGFIYVTTSSIDESDVHAAVQGKSKAGTYMPVKKFNSNGDEIMKRNGFWPPAGEIDYMVATNKPNIKTGPSTITDVAIGEEGTWSIIDEKRQKIFTYDANGSLLFAFGDSGFMLGNLKNIEGLTYQGSNMLVLDKTNDSITVFKRTEYGDILIDALAAENNQDFSLAIEKWTEVLKRNSNFDAAYVGIGRSLYRNGDYEGSLEYYEAAYDTANWSNSFKELRKEWMSKYFLVVIAIIVVVIVALVFASKGIKKVNDKATLSGKPKTFWEELMYGFYVILHPFDGFWDLKHEKRGSVRASLVYIAITILAFFYQSVGQGYILNPMGGYSSIFQQAIGVLVPLFLFVIANWCLTTLFEGEGSFKDVFIATSYSLLPLPLLIIPATIFSNFCISTEVQLISFVTLVAFGWLGLLLFFGTQVTHDYTIFKNILTIAGTIIGMAFIIFLVLLFSTLVGKMVSLVTNIVTEIQFRI